eukprot:4011884-Pleurochrysis_carterae.AAC.4
MLLNFDEWKADALATMEAVSRYLQLPPFSAPKGKRDRVLRTGNASAASTPFPYDVEEAHNTHIAGSRSVHLNVSGKVKREIIMEDQIEDKMSPKTHCILHEFYRPYLRELNVLLAEYDYPPMNWRTGESRSFKCSSEYVYWRTLRKGGKHAEKHAS